MSDLLKLAERVEKLGEPNQGMSWSSANHGLRRYDPETGVPYRTRGQPETLTVYGERAATLKFIIDNCEEIAAALRARAPLPVEAVQKGEG